MNCIFCPDIELFIERGQNSDNILHLRLCTACPTKYWFEGNRLLDYSFTTIYNGRYYLALFFCLKIQLLDKSFPSFKLYCSENPSKNILELDYLPNITPHNIFNKLSKLLAFV